MIQLVGQQLLKVMEICFCRKPFGIHEFDVEKDIFLIENISHAIDLLIKSRKSRMVGTDKQDTMLLCLRRRGRKEKKHCQVQQQNHYPGAVF